MTGKSLVAIIGALNAARVRYLVVGGLAVVAHGYLRYTADVDLVLDPDPESFKRAIAALAGLGYRPRAPVPFETFADPVNRASWRRDKGMLVFSIHSPDHAATEIVPEDARVRVVRVVLDYLKGSSEEGAPCSAGVSDAVRA